MSTDWLTLSVDKLCTTCCQCVDIAGYAGDFAVDDQVNPVDNQLRRERQTDQVPFTRVKLSPLAE